MKHLKNLITLLTLIFIGTPALVLGYLFEALLSGFKEGREAFPSAATDLICDIAGTTAKVKSQDTKELP